MDTQNTLPGIDQLKTLLRAETQRNENRARKTWAIGLVVLVLMMLYLGWIGYRFKNEVLNPYHLGFTLAQKISANMPTVLKRTEAQLSQQAPYFAGRTHRQIVSMIPTIGRAGRAQIDRLASFLPQMDQITKEAVQKFYAVSQDEIRTFYAAHHSAEDKQKFIAAMVDRFAEISAENMERDIQLTYRGKVFKGPRQLSILFLRKMNERFKHLAAMPASTMTPKERIERRLVVAWTRALGKYLGANIGANTR